MNKFIGICYYCREDVFEDDFVNYKDKPFHKRCIPKFKGYEEEIIE